MDRSARFTSLFLTLAVGACQSVAEPEESKPVDAAHSPIHFEHIDYDPDLAQYSVQSNARSRNKVYVARFYGTDAFAVLAAYKLGAGYVAKERPTEAYIGDILENADLDWGESGRTTSHMGPVPYRLFRVAGEPFSCVGFSQLSGESYDDLGRKRDLVFGFFCQDDSRPMSGSAAEELIGKISVGGRR